ALERTGALLVGVRRGYRSHADDSVSNWPNADFGSMALELTRHRSCWGSRSGDLGHAIGARPALGRAAHRSKVSRLECGTLGRRRTARRATSREARLLADRRDPPGTRSSPPAPLGSNGITTAASGRKARPC